MKHNFNIGDIVQYKFGGDQISIGIITQKKWNKRNDYVKVLWLIGLEIEVDHNHIFFYNVKDLEKLND